MEEGKGFIGLEIGSSKIAAVVGLQQQKKIRVIGFSERQISPTDEVLRFGNVENAQITSEFIGEVLDELAGEFERSDYEFQLNTVNINIANLSVNSHSKSTKVVTSGSMNRIQQEDVNRLTDDANRSFKVPAGHTVIHSLPKDFYVGDEKASGTVVGKIGNMLSGDFNFITTKSDNLHYLLECVNQVPAKGTTSGFLNVENVVLNVIADSCALLNNSSEEPETKRDGVAIVNIGAEMTQVCVYHGNSLRYQSVIPIAGNSINLDLEKAFGITFQEAELLKKVCGSISLTEESPIIVIERKFGMPAKEVYLKNAMTVAELRLREIAALVSAELTRSGYKAHLRNGIILTGGTSLYGNIAGIFTEVCKNVIVRPTIFNSAIDFNGFEQLRNPKYSTLLGLVTAPAFPFDRRVDNRVLTPRPIVNMHPQPEKETAATTEKDEKGSGLFSFMGGIFRRPTNDLNDEYNVQNVK